MLDVGHPTHAARPEPDMEHSSTDAQPWTVARIAEHLGVPRHRIEYLIESRGVRPIAWAGHARVFAPADVNRVRVELERIERDREGGAA